MSTDLAETFSNWEALESSLAQFREERDELAAFFARELEELDKLRSGLVDRGGKLQNDRASLADQRDKLEGWQRELEERRQELESQRGDLEQSGTALDEKRLAIEQTARELDDRARRLAEADAELAQARAKLASDAEEANADQQQDQANEREQLAQLEQERDQLSAELNEAQQEATRAAEAEQTAARLEEELEAARTHLEHLTAQEAARSDAVTEELQQKLESLLKEKEQWEHELNAARDSGANSQEATQALQVARNELSSARDQIDRLNEQLAANPPSDDTATERIAQLEEDRTALELELEAVRNRAAELADTAASEKRRAAEERAQWAAELKHLRVAMEGQARVLKDNDRSGSMAAAVSPNNGHSGGEAPAADANDPVLDSLMDQFQRLQKDRIKRRSTSRVAPQQEVA